MFLVKFHVYGSKGRSRLSQIVVQAREKCRKKPFFRLFPSARRFAAGKSWYKRGKNVEKLHFSDFFRAPDDSPQANRGTSERKMSKNSIFRTFSECQTIRRRQIVVQAREKCRKTLFFLSFPHQKIPRRLMRFILSPHIQTASFSASRTPLCISPIGHSPWRLDGIFSRCPCCFPYPSS